MSILEELVCCCESDPHLGLIGDGVPVSSSERELPAADTSQNLLRRVLRAVSEGSEAEDRESVNLKDYFNPKT